MLRIALVALCSLILPSLASGETPSKPQKAAAKPAPRRCPSGSVEVGSFCIDAWEASVRKGPKGPVAASRKSAPPQQEVTFEQAAQACRNAGKRLCSKSEWMAVCRGPAGKPRYVYGGAYDPKRCNGFELDQGAGTRPQVRATGAMPECRPPELEVWDLSGNVWEWVDSNEPGGARLICGGGFANAGKDLSCGCDLLMPERVRAGVGFRCCADR